MAKEKKWIGKKSELESMMSTEIEKVRKLRAKDRKRVEELLRPQHVGIEEDKEKGIKNIIDEKVRTLKARGLE